MRRRQHAAARGCFPRAAACVLEAGRQCPTMRRLSCRAVGLFGGKKQLCSVCLAAPSACSAGKNNIPLCGVCLAAPSASSAGAPPFPTLTDLCLRAKCLIVLSQNFDSAEKTFCRALLFGKCARRGQMSPLSARDKKPFCVRLPVQFDFVIMGGKAIITR